MGVGRGNRLGLSKLTIIIEITNLIGFGDNPEMSPAAGTGDVTLFVGLSVGCIATIATRFTRKCNDHVVPPFVRV
jgi:hypothetical protein